MDVIVSWPRSCDYPLWRQFIRDNRARFGEVFVVLTELAGKDISGFVRSNFPEATAIDSDGSGEWRDAAVNTALDRSTASHVWFTEQDFWVTDAFWPQLTGDLAGVCLDERPFHPACLLVSRELIEKTSRYFGPAPMDHFGRFGTELLNLAEPTYITTGFRHFQGISESQMLRWQGQEPRFKPEQFREWADANLAADVPIEPSWRMSVA
jgi:hypothetical protein